MLTHHLVALPFNQEILAFEGLISFADFFTGSADFTLKYLLHFLFRFALTFFGFWLDLHSSFD
jgi:hypothetical protein